MPDGTTVTDRRSGQVRALVDAVWVASALVTALEHPGHPGDGPAAEVLAWAVWPDTRPTGGP